MKCVAPRRVVNLMKAFVNDACTLDRRILVHKGADFSVPSPLTPLADYHKDIVMLYCFDDLSGESDEVFREYWKQHSDLVDKFADITLTLLHEVGHLEIHDKIRAVYPYEQRSKDLKKITRKHLKYADTLKAYYDLPDEHGATEWALTWLSDENNQKKAKEFEKKFAECFE